MEAYKFCSNLKLIGIINPISINIYIKTNLI